MRPAYEQPDYLAFTRGEFRAWALANTPEMRFTPDIGPRAVQLEFLAHGALRSRLESWAVSGCRAGIEYRYPLLDKRVVEFALGLPPEYYHRHGRGRYLFRRAVEGFLPHDVCWQSLKQEPVRVNEVVSLIARALRPLARELGAGESRFVDQHALAQFLESISAEDDRTWSVEAMRRLLAAFKSMMVLNLAEER